MIVETLLVIAVNLLGWFAGIVPDFGLDLSTLDLSAMWSGLGSGAAALNGWVPVVAMFAAAAVYLTVQVVMSGWGLIVWIYHQFWGSS